MHIEHVAIWTSNLEQLKGFYETYFEASAGTKYVNRAKQFESYFLTFASGCRLELMQASDQLAGSDRGEGCSSGYAHLALSTGSGARVDALTARLERDGFWVIDGPRWTGDGYYESRVLDYDGNPIEITI
jgi:lactoylglutathione lyase